MVKKKYVHNIQQFENDCGHTVILTLLTYYGYDVNRSTLQEYFNYSSLELELADMYHFFEQINSGPKLYEVTLDKISKESKFLFPCIALDCDTNHYFVIYKDLGNYYIISDPGSLRIEKRKNKKQLNNKYIIITLQNSEDIAKYLSKTPINNKYKKVLKNLLTTEYLDVSYIFVLSVFLAVASIVSSLFVGIIIDFISKDNSNSEYYIVVIVNLFFLIYIIQMLIAGIQNSLKIKVAMSLEKKITKKYFDSIFKMETIDYNSRNVGEYITRLNDSLQIINIITNVFVSSMVNIITIIISLIIIYVKSKLLFNITLISIIILFGFTVLFHKKYKTNNERFMEANAQLNSVVVSILDNIEGINAINSKSYHMNKLRSELNKSLGRSEILGMNILKNTFVQVIIVSILLSLFTYISSILAINSIITVGELSALISLVNLNITNLKEILSNQTEYEQFFVSFARLIDIIQEKVIGRGEKLELLEKIHTIKFENYEIGYDGKLVIQNSTFELLPKDSFIFCRGKSGIGKTTIFKSLIKYVNTYNGVIRINGIDIKNLDSNLLREKIIYCSNNEKLFEGTLLENLSLEFKIAKNKVIEFCKITQLLDFIEELPNGFNTNVNKDGGNFSMGQKQKICLTRVLLRNPEILIMDESLSNIDKDTVSLILSSIKRLEICVIYISHNYNSQNDGPELLIGDDKVIQISKVI